MSSNEKSSLAFATAVATAVVEQLQPWCEKIHVAGSVRRMVSEVGDIEVVCLPRKDGDGPLKGWVDAVTSLGLMPVVKNPTPIAKRRAVKLTLPWANGIQLDLFIPQAHDYGRILAIRTGSADFSHKVLAGAWTKQGWVGTKDGLRRRDQCEQARDESWHLREGVIRVNMPPEFNTEEEFFRFINLKWMPPEQRYTPKSR